MRGRRGFTLIEVVAALALTGLVLLTVAGAYFTLHRSLTALVTADGRARQRALYRRVRADLEAAYVSPNVALPPFSGEADRMAFAARQGPTGLSRVEYLPGAGGLERRVAPWAPAEEEGAAATSAGPVSLPAARATPVLAPGWRARFRYLSRNGGWSDRWSSESEGGLPAAVEVVVVAEAGELAGAPGPPPGAKRRWVLPLYAGGPPPGSETP